MAPEGDEPRFWTRLRWRRRGAWQWPLFFVFVVAEAVLLHELPIAGDGTGIWPALLLAGFLNVAVAAVAAPLGGRWLRRRRPDLPRVVADDRAGTAALVVLAAALVAGGLIHRPAVLDSRHAFRAQSDAVRRYVAARAAAVYKRNIDRADTWQVGDDLYRTCVPGDDPRRAFCLFVSTDQSPPGVRVDANHAPNARYIGPNAIGRERG
ncbi:MAG: hypothetical protein QOI98_251 [Solirubrobacteraceae bacterium]|jgi:hypothetical protein|nr:hypothetical protein [Solirubrobacteraceae bacterium]